MNITHHADQSIISTTKPHDDLAKHAVAAYGFLLNTPERRGKTHTGPEFAAIIEQNFDSSVPHNDAIIRHLKNHA